ncbi:MAG: hypothetical protein LUP94_03625 [Candidatus Methanomethylicus sp.]|nr:hypothetical protein [Candidatus Methanomethylicus sp.]
MTSSDAALAKLKDIGLTGTEAQVFLALISGEADAKKLSQISGVPYSKIHTVLSGLVKKAFVTENKGRPALYSAKKVSEALQDYKKNLYSGFDRRFEDAGIALDKLEAMSESEKPDIWIIKSQEGILKRAYQTINGAKIEVKFALPATPALLMMALMPVLTRLKSEKISLKLLLSTNAPSDVIKKLSALGNIRIRDKMFGGGIIADDNDVILLLGSDANIPSLAIASNHAALVHLARTYFDNLWESSEEALT